jgi:hypothetical protein
MMLPEDKKPEATRLIGWSWNALQRQTRIQYDLMHQILLCHSICWWQIKSMTQAK